MRVLSNQMLLDLQDAIAAGGSHGDLETTLWKAAWRTTDRRIEDKVRENVLTFHHVEIAQQHRGKGHFTELLRHLDEHPVLAGRSIAWIYLEQCHFRLATHLERELLYQSDFGVVIDCWRRVTGQLEMRL